jgi:hypothetical protein
MKFSKQSASRHFVPLYVDLTGKGSKSEVAFYSTKHHAMKLYGGVEVQHHAFLTSALGGNEWSGS